ncbi:hypothetical protein DSO57_1032164 [Entomophthora muscae]|uniref:Uncharacterized protein n=1 Tax=Entomophthora muscae TaxID=34485 RepID=A0ACC2SPG6_9FUNG|nr:hypothetical protein DSO57_1032164 [Entomophthora muscae]
MEEKSNLKLSLFLRRLAGEHHDDVLNLLPAGHCSAIQGNEVNLNKRRSWFMRSKVVSSRASMDLSHLRSFNLKPQNLFSRQSLGTEKLQRKNTIDFDDLIDKKSCHSDTTIRISLTPKLAQDKSFIMPISTK